MIPLALLVLVPSDPCLLKMEALIASGRIHEVRTHEEAAPQDLIFLNLLHEAENDMKSQKKILQTWDRLRKIEE